MTRTGFKPVSQPVCRIEQISLPLSGSILLFFPAFSKTRCALRRHSSSCQSESKFKCMGQMDPRRKRQKPMHASTSPEFRRARLAERGASNGKETSEDHSDRK